MLSKTVKALVYAALVTIICNSGYAAEEEFNLTKSIQKDLVLLGYEPGNVDGEVTLQTAVAISQFQSHNNLDVTGEVTPQLAGILAAKTSGPPQPLAQSAPLVEPSAQTEPAPQSESVEQATAVPQPVPEAVAVAAEPPAEPTEVDPEVLEAARQECIQEKIAEAQKAEKKRRGYGSLASAVGKSASLLGSDDVAKTVGDVSVASSTASDLASAAKDLGLTEDDLEECENPL